MSKSYEDNKGNFRETFSDGTVSRNGNPVGVINRDGEFLPENGNGQYVFNDHKIINNGETVGTYDIHGNVTFYDNDVGGSAGELNRSSPGLRSETKLVLLLIAGIIVRYFLIAAVVTVLLMLAVCITVTVTVAVKLRKRKKQKNNEKETR